MVCLIYYCIISYFFIKFSTLNKVSFLLWVHSLMCISLLQCLQEMSSSSHPASKYIYFVFGHFFIHRFLSPISVVISFHILLDGYCIWYPQWKHPNYFYSSIQRDTFFSIKRTMRGFCSNILPCVNFSACHPYMTPVLICSVQYVSE